MKKFIALLSIVSMITISGCSASTIQGNNEQNIRQEERVRADERAKIQAEQEDQRAYAEGAAQGFSKQQIDSVKSIINSK